VENCTEYHYGNQDEEEKSPLASPIQTDVWFLRPIQSTTIAKKMVTASTALKAVWFICDMEL
jgi:hypothetical protein